MRSHRGGVVLTASSVPYREVLWHSREQNLA